MKCELRRKNKKHYAVALWLGGGARERWGGGSTTTLPRSAFSRRERGTVAITFLLALPIFLWIICVMVQYALLVNARMGVDRAVMAAARSAMTSLPTDPEVDYVDGDHNVRRAAWMALEPLSPKATQMAMDAQDVVGALENLGVSVPSSYAARYSYAQEATTVEWTRIDDNDNPIPGPEWLPLDYAEHTGQRIKLTIKYRFHINVPGIRSMPGFATDDNVGGINGKFMTLTSSHIVQLTHGRQAGVNNAQ